jgi:hypothetical protein
MFTINYMLKIKELKRVILKKYYNMFNANLCYNEVLDNYNKYNLGHELYVTFEDFLILIDQEFSYKKYTFLLYLKESIKKIRGYIVLRNQSLKYPYTNYIRMYYLPNRPVYQHMTDIGRMFKNAINIELIQQGISNTHASIKFKTVDEAVAAVTNNELLQYGTKYCVIGYGYPDKKHTKTEEELQKGYNTAISCFNYLDL